MFKKAFLATAVLLALATGALAQNSAAKNELITKILQMQRPALEGIATEMAQLPARQIMQGAGIALQNRIAPDKREALAKEIETDLKKYVDDAVPFLRDKVVKLAPTTVGTLLEEKFTEDELRQLIAIMESPVNKKFTQMNGEFQKALREKLVAETRSTIDPKVKALDATIAKRLGITPPPAAAPAKPASSGK